MKLHEHSNREFSKHADSLKQSCWEKIIAIQAMIAKGNIHKQMCDYEKKSKAKRK